MFKRHSTHAKLDREMKRDRRQLLLAGVMAVLAVAALEYVTLANLLGAHTRDVDAVVTYSKLSLDTDTGRYRIYMQGRLRDGAIIDATGLPQTPPKVGDTVILSERRNNFFGVVYTWTGMTK